MKCPKCKTELVQSNINHNCENCDYGDMFYTQYFCFNCSSLYECASDSGDYIEEYLELIEK